MISGEELRRRGGLAAGHPEHVTLDLAPGLLQDIDEASAIDDNTGGNQLPNVVFRMWQRGADASENSGGQRGGAWQTDMDTQGPQRSNSRGLGDGVFLARVGNPRALPFSPPLASD